MSLDENEKKLLARIKELGLYRTVRHARYEIPYKLRNGLIDAETTVVLRDDKDNEPVSVGTAHKSVLDKNFHKQLGRVIATGRALKKYETGTV